MEKNCVNYLRKKEKEKEKDRIQFAHHLSFLSHFTHYLYFRQFAFSIKIFNHEIFFFFTSKITLLTSANDDGKKKKRYENKIVETVFIAYLARGLDGARAAAQFLLG